MISQGAAMKRSLRRLCAVSVTAIGFTFALAFAQSTPSTPAQTTPPKLEPLPEVASDTELEPQVTITRREGETVEEGRVNGQVMWIKVTPIHMKRSIGVPSVCGQLESLP